MRKEIPALDKGDKGDKGDAAFEMAEIIRSMIRHENDLMHHRTQWLATFQGLLFAALGFTWKITDALALVVLLSVVGIVSALSGHIALTSAADAIENLKGWWEVNRPVSYKGPDVIGLRRKESWKDIFVTWNLLPWLFVVAWVLVPILYRFFPNLAKP